MAASQGGAAPRKRRKSSAGRKAGAEGVASEAPAVAEEPTPAAEAPRASEAKGAGSEAEGAKPLKGRKARPAGAKARKRAAAPKDGDGSEAGDEAIEGGLLGVAGNGDNDEECPGMLLTDLVDSPMLLSGKAKRERRGKQKAKARPEPEVEEDLLGLSDGEAPGGAEEAASGERLLQAVAQLASAEEESGSNAVARQRAQAQPESEFNAGSMGEEVTMDDLLAPLEEAKNFREVRKQLQGLAKTQVVQEPKSEVQKGREERKVQYKDTCKDMGKWIPQLIRNRDAEQVVLGEVPKVEQTMATLVSETQETDDFEKELAEITRAAGAADEDISVAGPLPMNPRIRNQEQRNQIAKLKALLFREQQASKRVKKIKSKAYHRIHRKAELRQRETLLQRLDTENPEMAEALRHEFEKEHANLRMLRHRNARRKWAKTMQRFAKSDKGAHREISKQAQTAHDEERGLRRAIRGQKPEQSDDSEAVDLSGSDSDGEGGGKRGAVGDTVDRAKKLTVKEIKGLEAGGDMPTTGLMGMGFMRNAILKRREEAKKEAQGVLQELEGLNKGLGSDAEAEAEADNGDGKAVKPADEEPSKAKRKTRKKFSPEELAAARKQIDEMSEHEDVAVECSVSGPLTVKGVAKGSTAPQRPSKRKAVTASTATPAAGSQAPAAPVNPWLEAAPVVSAANGAGAAEGTAAEAAEPPSVAVAELPSATSEQASAGAAPEEEPAQGRRKRKGRRAEQQPPPRPEAMPTEDVLSVLNADSEAAREQRELVRTAFVEGTQEDDFLDEQEELARQKEEKAKGPEELAGWGHWTGEGAPVPRQRRQQQQKQQKHQPQPDAKDAANKTRSGVHFSEAAEKPEKSAKYFVEKVPWPFKNPAQYDLTMRMPLGPEWNTRQVHKQHIKPKVFVKVGAIVPPLAYVKQLPEETRADVIKTWAEGKQPKRLKAHF